MKRNSMTLYVGRDVHSQRLHIALAEKAIAADIIQVDENNVDPNLLELSPDGKLPILIDRDLVLDIASVMSEYLDERFPHPPLLPVYPVARAKFRLLIGKIEQDWYPALGLVESQANQKNIDALMKHIMALVPLLDDNEFFLSNEFSLVDCAIAPILWRLVQLKVDLAKYSPRLAKYAKTIFAKDSFQASLTEQELYAVMADEVQ